MPAPDNPLVSRVTLVFNKDVRTFLNTFHVSKTTPWNQTDMAALALVFDNWHNNFYEACLPATTLLTQIQVRKLDPDDPQAYDLQIQPPRPGIRAGLPAPANATTTMSWRTGLAGRKFRGRDYVAGMLESDINDFDQVASPLLTNLAAAAGQLLLALAGSNLNLAIFHRATNLFTVVTSFVIEQLVDSQRRRLPGRGR